MKNNISADELLNLISCQWATTKDIMLIGGIGEARALKIKKSIFEELLKAGYTLPRNKVPMEIVIRHFKINIEFLKKVSNERRIK